MPLPENHHLANPTEARLTGTAARGPLIKPDPGAEMNGLESSLSPSRGGPPWHAWEVFLLIGGFFGAQALFSSAISAGLTLWMPSVFGADPDRLVLYSLPVGLISSYIAGTAGVGWLLIRRHRLVAQEVLALRPYPLRGLAGPFLGGIALQFLARLGFLVYPPEADQEPLFSVFLGAGPWAVGFFFIVAVVAAPLMEEVLFRGLLLPALLQRFRFSIAALAVTGLFTALHGFSIGGYWPALVGIFLCGWFLAKLRVSRGTLWAPIAFHMGFNFAAFIPVLFILSGELLPN